MKIRPIVLEMFTLSPYSRSGDTYLEEGRPICLTKTSEEVFSAWRVERFMTEAFQLEMGLKS